GTVQLELLAPAHRVPVLERDESRRDVRQDTVAEPALEEVLLAPKPAVRWPAILFEARVIDDREVRVCLARIITILVARDHGVASGLEPGDREERRENSAHGDDRVAPGFADERVIQVHRLLAADREAYRARSPPRARDLDLVRDHVLLRADRELR